MLVAFATARPKRSVLPFAERIPADAIIFCNGAGAFANDTRICNFGIAEGDVRTILLALSAEHPDLKLYTEINDRNYANFNPNAYISGVESYVHTDFHDLPNGTADKIGAILEHYSADIFEKHLTAELYIQLGATLNASGDTLVNILNRNASKSNCVIALSEHFNIPLTDIAAFGDDHNDVEMLRLCGTGVAMSNAIAECKAAADHICGDCDDDGAARWIEQHVLAS